MDGFNWHFDFERANADSNAEPAQEPSTSRNSAPVRNHQERLLDLQAESFGREELADIEIHVGDDHVFKVNRYFLCLHSDVFSAYLNNNSVEKKTNVIQIKDLDPVFIEAMLRFMYSGRVENLKDIAHDLYIVADRYNVRILQDICLEFMFSNLDMKHIFNCLELAFQLDMEDLKQKSIEFAIKNIKQLQEQEEWVPLVKRNPDIAISLLQHLTNENEKLKAKVADLESQKCPVHHCRLPHHEMLLRHDRNRQLQRLRDQLRQNEEANEEPMRHDRYYQLIMNYIRRQRERRNLPPLEQLPIEERNAIIAQAHNDLGPHSDDDYPVRELQRANPIRAVEDGGRQRHIGRLWGYRPNQRLREALEAEAGPAEQRRRRFPNFGNVPRVLRQRQPEQQGNAEPEIERFDFLRNRRAPEFVPPVVRPRQENEDNAARQPHLQVIELLDESGDSDMEHAQAEPEPAIPANQQEAEPQENAVPQNGAERRLFVQLSDSDSDSEN